MHRRILVVLLALACSVAMAQNVPVTERRVSEPFRINWDAAYKLASHIFAAKWIKTCKPVWCSSYPSPARITTCYGKPIAGDSLTPVDDKLCQRPCWVFWKERGLTGVAVEQGEGGNTIVSTFTVLRQPETVVREREVVRETLRTHTEYIQNPGTVTTVFLSTGGYRPPAGITQVGTTNLHVPNGQTFYGPEENQVYVSFRRQQDVVCKPQPEPPPGDDCVPGGSGDDPPPNSGEVNVPPHDPSGQPPGGDPHPPGVGPPPPAPPDHGIITGPDVPPHAPRPEGEHQADPIVENGV
ncbi:MAG: hypothetical protein WC451_05635 [Patescibacteria group bacterium]|jgi:hypothetical protein